MSFLARITCYLRIRARSLYNFYVFENLGIPPIKQERISKSLLKKFLPANPIIVDCGAHDGADSVDLAAVLKGQVHAFEPVPEIYERLTSRVKRYDAPVKCYQLALSNERGEVQFHVSGGTSDASSSLLRPKSHVVEHPTVTFDKVISVRTETLDSWAESEGVNRVDLLWLDMQGAELAMLRSSTKILPTVKAIHTEISVKETYEGVGLYSDLQTFLETQGFEVAYKALPEGADMGNVVFRRVAACK